MCLQACVYALASVHVCGCDFLLRDLWPVQVSGGEQQLLSLRTDLRSELDP